jgi:hypothetical protein
MMQPLQRRDVLCKVLTQEGSRNRELPKQMKTGVKTNPLVGDAKPRVFLSRLGCRCCRTEGGCCTTRSIERTG